MEGFYTLSQKTISEQTIDKSRFIGIGTPVHSLEQINQAMEGIRQDYPNARHYVYAYRLHEGNLEKASDDGEPQGTGGRPVLDILKHQNLWNILLVVVRYFGGVLLGTGGLTRAYGSTAKLVFEGVQLVRLTLFHQYQLSLTYEWYSSLKYQFEQRNWRIRDEEFLEVIRFIISVPENQTDLFLKWLADFTRNQVTYQDKGIVWE
ncbi:YigZ family protein [Desulfosporosinus sp. SYSU MS00001]|uniref:YigZ family protein n=1 Tax=Desulfosporosinus sp. SYSU MS00001 TaxID=3416284 RepID=UPI003CF2F9D8